MLALWVIASAGTARQFPGGSPAGAALAVAGLAAAVALLGRRSRLGGALLLVAAGAPVAAPALAVVPASLGAAVLLRRR